MTQLKIALCAFFLTFTISSTALAGNIPVLRTSGNIPVPRTSGNIPVLRTSGNIPVPRSNSSINVEARFSLSQNIGRLIQLLIENGGLF